MVSRESIAVVFVDVKFSDAFPLANLLGERSEQFHAARMISHTFPAKVMTKHRRFVRLPSYWLYTMDLCDKCFAGHATRRGIVRTVLPERVSARENASANSAWSLPTLELLSEPSFQDGTSVSAGPRGEEHTDCSAAPVRRSQNGTFLPTEKESGLPRPYGARFKERVRAAAGDIPTSRPSPPGAHRPSARPGSPHSGTRSPRGRPHPRLSCRRGSRPHL